jgi:hypothetical protein
MFKRRKIGFGLAVALGLMTAPVMADEACQKAMTSINKATATLTSMQQLFDQIKQRQANSEGAVASASSDEPLKCPACGMMMPTKATRTMRRAVKYNGKTYYCCRGCDMSQTADK